jgi:hypothetical protein
MIHNIYPNKYILTYITIYYKEYIDPKYNINTYNINSCDELGSRKRTNQTAVHGWYTKRDRPP